MSQEFKRSAVRLLLGLGNPGRSYAATYHNAGMLFIRFLARRLTITRTLTLRAVVLHRTKQGFVLALPRVFMNESGRAACAALQKLRLTPSALLGIHDDADLLLGSSTMSFGRGAAGHKGVLSLYENLGTTRFWRLRIGIRPINPIAHRKKAGDFVLSPMPKAHSLLLHRAFEEASRTYGLLS